MIASAIFEGLFFLTGILLLWWVSRDEPMKHIDVKEFTRLSFPAVKEHRRGLGIWRLRSRKARRQLYRRNQDFVRPSLTAR